MLLLAACGEDPRSSDETAPRFVTTIPPFEMILRPVVKGRGTVHALLEPGTSPHAYDPPPADVQATTEGTALVYGADPLDGWAADLPASRRVALIDLLPSSGALPFERIGDASQKTVDPHFWTSPEAVRHLLPALADTLCAVDPPGCSTYRANADTFSTALAALDTRLEALVAPVQEVPVLLAQPFFRYFLDRYGPRLVGVVEPRPGAEPTPQQLHVLVRRARESGARAILTQRHLSARASRAVGEAATMPLVEIDPLGGHDGRTTYADLLVANAQLLRDSLSAMP